MQSLKWPHMRVGWCSWLSRMLHTHKVPGSSPGSIIRCLWQGHFFFGHLTIHIHFDMVDIAYDKVIDFLAAVVSFWTI